MTTPDSQLEEVAGRLVDDQEYMTIDAPDKETGEEDKNGNEE